MTRVAILGSTGSIGTNTLDVIQAMPERFEVISLSAASRIEQVCDQAKTFGAKRVCVAEGLAQKASQILGDTVEVVEGNDGLVELAEDRDVDMVINGLVAGVGIRPTIAALQAGRDVATANKETLVVAGEASLVRGGPGGGWALDDEGTTAEARWWSRGWSRSRCQFCSRSCC